MSALTHQHKSNIIEDLFWPSKTIKTIVDCEINYTKFGKLISHLFNLKFSLSELTT